MHIILLEIPEGWGGYSCVQTKKILGKWGVLHKIFLSGGVMDIF